jgi:hypothetical protein
MHKIYYANTLRIAYIYIVQVLIFVSLWNFQCNFDHNLEKMHKIFYANTVEIVDLFFVGAFGL